METTEARGKAALLLKTEDLELRNDDGFVYKRRRRDTDVSASLDPSVSEAADPVAEENARRERKRMKMLKLKAQYQKEIDQWEKLSSTLAAMAERTSKLQEQQRREQEREQTAFFTERRSLPGTEGQKPACGSLVDELLCQVEAREAIIRNVSDLCDIAEALCNVQKEQFRQSLIDLPVWGSPRELMASLTEDNLDEDSLVRS